MFTNTILEEVSLQEKMYLSMQSAHTVPFLSRYLRKIYLESEHMNI